MTKTKEEIENSKMKFSGKKVIPNHRRKAYAERLDNHNYRDRRDLNILKRIRPSVRNRTQADYLPNQYIKKVKSDD